MSEIQEFPALDITTLKPPMNITLVTPTSGLDKLKSWADKLLADPNPICGLDTETQVTTDFWFRRVRTIQIGDKENQFVVDMLSFAGDEDTLIASQGNYGKNNADIYADIFSILDPIITTGKVLKVGQNLSFEYEVLKWSFDRRIWHLYSTDLAERVIQAGGNISLKQYTKFSMLALMERYFNITIDKSKQKSFDLKTPLTQEQIEYAALDIRMPLALRLMQLQVLVPQQLLTTATIEFDALGSYTDMHLTGQNMDDVRWKKRIEVVKERRVGEVKELDEVFIPIVGRKSEAINYAELERREKIWREGFSEPTEAEVQKAAEIRLEKDKEKKEVLRTELKALKDQRSVLKSEARSAYTELSKERTKKLKLIEKCEGEAFLNYGSNAQLLEALKTFRGMGAITSVGDEVLIKFNDRPIIQTLRKYRKGKKETGTYGDQWISRWITKPCKEEGFRHPGDGRLHCLFNQLEAETGRSSSSKPNAQNLPKDDEVRACFICDNPEENCIVTVDMSGCELRIIAELSQSPSWLTAFNKQQDVHSVSCEILYPEKWPSLTEADCEYFKLDKEGKPSRQKCKCKGHKELREKTKAVNFLLAYGGGPDALADQINVNLEAAKELMRLHEQKFPEVWSYLTRSGEEAKRKGEARDMYGRRRLFVEPNYDSARKWVMDYEEENLELNEEECELALFTFKAKELREPNESEKWALTHRAPTDKEIKQGMRAMISSIARKGKNHCIQGTNASLAKRVMGCGIDASGKEFLWHLLPQYDAKFINFVHDEFVIECPRKYGQEVLECVQDAIKRAGQEVFKVITMESEGRIADRWQK